MMKIKNIFIAFFLIICNISYATETINVSNAGTLESSILAQSTIAKENITDIIINGYLNDTDIALLKTLSTSNSLKTIDLYNVTLTNNALAATAFKSTTKLESIVLPKSLTSMGNECFHSSAIKTIEIPTKNLTTIPTSCFAWCQQLTELAIPEGVTTLGGTSLVYCSSLSKLTLPSTLTSILSSAVLGNLGFAPWTVEIPLTEIRANMLTPPTIVSSSFWLSTAVKASCKLYVPYGTKAAYQANINGSSGFGTIANILEDYATQTPVIITDPAAAGYDYSTDKLSFFMSSSIERTPGGRLWSNWIAGGDSDDAFTVLSWSDDNGTTWTDPKVVIDPHDVSLSEKRRSIVSVLWTDPNGKLWFFFDYGMTYYDGRAGVWATVCENPDAVNPTWSTPKRIWHGFVLNKPIVLSSGEWVLPVYLWPRTKLSSPYINAFKELDRDRISHAFVSTDQGQTWEKRGGVLFPYQDFDESHITQKNDGSLWMTARTSDGIYQSSSTDKGYTWSAPTKYMTSAVARHHISRLASGNLLLIKDGRINYDDSRKNMTAYLSTDDGATWQGGLLLDERSNVTYPDATQGPDGTIYAAYDIRGEIFHMAAFTEADILAQTFSSANSVQKGVIAPFIDGSVAVNVSTAGGLQTEIENAITYNKIFVRELSATGSLNSTDIALLKSLSTSGKLRSIDISGVSLANNELLASAFDGSSVADIKLPPTLTTMGNMCFNKCQRLVNIDIPTTGLQTIPDKAFTWCSSLKEIEIPEGVQRIGANAFTFCGSLTKITLPSTLTSIGEGAILGSVNSTFSVPIPLAVINAKMATAPSVEAHGVCLGISTDPLWSTCTLYVPSGSLSSYRANVYTDGYGYGFGKIINIVEQVTTEKPTILNNDLKLISLGNNEFVINTDKTGDILYIFSVEGKLFNQVKVNSNETHFSISSPGIYILKTGDDCLKIVI